MDRILRTSDLMGLSHEVPGIGPRHHRDFGELQAECYYRNIRKVKKSEASYEEASINCAIAGRYGRLL